MISMISIATSFMYDKTPQKISPIRPQIKDIFSNSSTEVCTLVLISAEQQTRACVIAPGLSVLKFLRSTVAS